MQKLSDDLLYLVFLNTLPSRFKLKTLPRSIASIAPLNLALVCRSWRALVLSRPKLWASINVQDGPLKTQFVKYFCQVVTMWLHRSASLPLKIYIRLGPYRNDLKADLPKHLLPLLLQEQHRWEYVYIDIDNKSLRAFKPTIHVTSSPPLAHLFLHWNFYDNQTSIASIDLSPSVRGATSQLHTLNIGRGTKICLPLNTDKLYLPNLFELNSKIEPGSDLDDTLAVLAASPRLSVFNIEDQYTLPPTPFSRQRTISLPYLKKFGVCSNALNTTYRLLDILSCPSLQEFAFENYFEPSEYLGAGNEPTSIPTVSLQRFFARSRPPLIVLCLIYDPHLILPSAGGDMIHATTLKELFAILSGTLQELRCAGNMVDNTFIDMLSEHQRPTSEGASEPFLLCPLINSFTLYGSEGTDIGKEIMENMLVSRWKSGEGALEDVELRIAGFDNFVKESARVTTCVDEGLEINIIQDSSSEEEP